MRKTVAVDALGHLLELYADIEASEQPRLPSVGGLNDLSDVPLLVREEFYYLDGLITSYLKVRAAPSTATQAARNEARLRDLLEGRASPSVSLRVDAIRLDRSIGERLAAATPSPKVEREAVRELTAYWRKLVELAQSLSAASGAPIVWWEGNPPFPMEEE